MIRLGRDYTVASAQRSALVVAPHPDDETLGCGARIRHARLAGTPISVVVATDGAASHGPHAADRETLAELRTRELGEATRHLGLDADRVHRLDFPDGQLAEHLDELTRELVRLILQLRPDEIYCTSAWESHPDHAAAAVAVRLAIAELDFCPRLFEYPIWLWGDWPLSRKWLRHGPRDWLSLLIGRRVFTVDVEPIRGAKVAAIASYGSQLGEAVDGVAVGLPKQLIARAESGPELFFEMRS
ncbi:MAG: LmbE family protein [Frankiales bacterium]|nr:LmbE family protein [Frankiales bacterium]